MAAGEVQGEQFAAAGPDWLDALDAEGAGLGPDGAGGIGHDAGAMQFGEDGFDDGGFTGNGDAGADDQAKAGEALFVLLLDELIVEGGTAEAGGKDAFHHVDHLAADEADAFAGELAVAMDIADMFVVAEALEGAAAGAGFDDAVVVDFGIDEDEGGGVEEGGDVEGGDAGIGAGDGTFVGEDLEGVGEDVEVVGRGGMGAADGDAAGFGEAIGGKAAGARGEDAGDLGGGRRLAGDDEGGPGEVETEFLGGDADAEGAADGGVDEAGAGTVDGRGGPAGDVGGFVDGDDFRPGQGNANEAGEQDGAVGDELEAPGGAWALAWEGDEPLVGGAAVAGSAEDVVHAAGVREDAAPDGFGDVEDTVGMEQEHEVSGLNRVVVEVLGHARTGAGGAAGFGLVGGGEEGIAEVFGGHGEGLAAADDGLAALHFVEGDVDSGIAEGTEGGLEALAVDEVAKVTHLAASEFEEPGVGTVGPGEDAAFDEAEEALIAAFDALTDEDFGGVQRDGVAEEPGQRGGEAEIGGRLLEDTEDFFHIGDPSTPVQSDDRFEFSIERSEGNGAEESFAPGLRHIWLEY